MFERFTDKGRKIIILAREESRAPSERLPGHQEHLVLGHPSETDGIALMILKKWASRPNRFASKSRRNLPGGGTTMTFGKFLSAQIKKSHRVRGGKKPDYSVLSISAASICCSASCVKRKASAEDSESLGANLPDCPAAHGDLPESLLLVRERPQEQHPGTGRIRRDLTQLAQEGQLDPVIGRADEIERVLQILSRRPRIIPC